MSWAFIKSNLIFFVFALLLVGCHKKGDRDEIKIYLASSLTPVGQELQKLSSSNFINMVFLSSSAIAKHIEQGAPCDAAVVADDVWRAYLVDRKLVEQHISNIGKNSLVLAGSVKSDMAPDALTLRRHLTNAERLIIADPEFVPLGSYSQEVLKNLGVFHDMQKKFLRAHSARHASLLLKQGAAPLALLYHSDALSDGNHVVLPIPSTLHRPIEYPFLRCLNAKPAHIEFLKDIFSSKKFNDFLVAKGFW